MSTAYPRNPEFKIREIRDSKGKADVLKVSTTYTCIYCHHLRAALYF